MSEVYSMTGYASLRGSVPAACLTRSLRRRLPEAIVGQEAERLGDFEIKHELEFRWLQYWKIAWQWAAGTQPIPAPWQSSRVPVPQFCPALRA